MHNNSWQNKDPDTIKITWQMYARMSVLNGHAELFLPVLTQEISAHLQYLQDLQYIKSQQAINTTDKEY